MQEENKHIVIYLTAVLCRLKEDKHFWGPVGAVKFSRFITRFLNRIDERKAIEARTEVYLDASLYAKNQARAEKSTFRSFFWKILGWWDAWRAKQCAERLQDFCGLFAMNSEHLGTCVSVYRNMGRNRRALGFVREALGRESVMHSQRIKFLIDGAEILDSLNRPKDTEDFYTQAFSIGPEGYLDKIRFFRSYGAYQLRKGDKDGARASLKMALEVATKNFADTWERDIQTLLAQIER